MSPVTITGYANPKCFARELNNCSQKISGEHFLTKALLKIMETPGKMTVQGPSWLPQGVERKVSSESLSSKMLCKSHNSVLSGLDKIATNFCEYLLNNKTDQRILSIDGHDIELWMLKMLCGFAASGYLKGFSGWTPKEEWLRILFSNNRIPDGCGLYYLNFQGKLSGKTNEMGIWPVIGNDPPEIVGIHFLLAGYTFLFLMENMPKKILGKYLQNGFEPVYRPEIVRIIYETKMRELRLGTSSGEIITVTITK